MMTAKRCRSLLFVPASRLDMIDRAHQRGADVVILDLEDGVAEADKFAARQSLNSQLEKLHSHGVDTMVRINSLEAGGALDLQAMATSHNTAVLVPKVSDPEQLLAVRDCWLAANKDQPDLQLLPMIECPRGLFRAEQIATAASNVSGLIFGSEDFAAEAGLSTQIEALAMPAQWVALAAAAAGIPAYGLPGALGNYHDMALFETTLLRAKTIGFTGSLCVHPKQVLLANEIFKPSQEEIQWAIAVMAQAGDGGATGGDMGMVDAPVVARARALLAHCDT
ncbi:MAG: citrate lyase subunit beta/citryl-CoA lyase [Halioglobus sp.]|jgi:citrate lyase subunit beta/citryl-CoA lyase